MNNLKKIDQLAKANNNKNKKKETPTVKYKKPELIDDYVLTKKRLKRTEEQLREKEKGIKSFGEDAILARALSDKFTKSINIKGKNHEVKISKPDRFMIKTDKPEEKLRSILGKKFDSLFKKERMVSVRNEIFENEKLLEKLLSKFNDEELEDYFNFQYTVKTKEGFDKEQHNLSPKEREQLKDIIQQVAVSVIIVK